MMTNPLPWIDQFLNYLGQQKAYSPHTLAAYRKDIDSFSSFNNANLNKALDEIVTHDIRQFSAYLHRQGRSGRSIQRVLSALSSFFRFLEKEAVVDANPVSSVTAPKAKKRLPSVMDIDQLEQLLRIDETDPLALRDRAIIELFYSSGLRLSELVDLDVGQLDMQDATVRVTGKGNKTRIVPVGEKAIVAIKQWLKARRLLVKDEQSALFLSRQGQRLKQRSIQARLRQWGIKQGVSDQVHPHRLRHSFASHLLESSGDIRAVQELLGHANISTTQIYTHLDFQHLAKVYDQAHPRAKKK